MIEPTRIALVFALLALLVLLEQLVPLRSTTRSLLSRLVVNACVALLAFAVAMRVVAPAAVGSLEWASSRPFGLVHAGQMPAAVRFIATFLLMDLSFYWWHVANHRIAFLWRFHNVHHIDPDLDASTAFRFHFGEVALSALFRVVQVSIIGPEAWMFAAYELAFQANTVFHHSNIRLPIRFERILNLAIVTPRMHGIHHSRVRDETNSNYSVVFSWWDRLHRTMGLNVPQSAIVVGIPGYSYPLDNRLRNVLLLPFQRQRDYWRLPDGTPVQRDELSGRRSRLAE